MQIKPTFIDGANKITYDKLKKFFLFGKKFPILQLVGYLIPKQRNCLRLGNVRSLIVQWCIVENVCKSQQKKLKSMQLKLDSSTQLINKSYLLISNPWFFGEKRNKIKTQLIIISWYAVNLLFSLQYFNIERSILVTFPKKSFETGCRYCFSFTHTSSHLQTGVSYGFSFPPKSVLWRRHFVPFT